MPSTKPDFEYFDVPYEPTRGVNYALPEDALGDGEVTDARNFLFENGVAITRPGLGVGTATAGTTPTVFNLPFMDEPISNGSFSVSITNDGKIWAGNVVQITGAAVSFGANVYHNGDLVNGVVMLGNNTGGLVNTAYPGNTTYTVVSTAKYRYVRGHLSRAVAAYQLTGAITDPLLFAWSATGDQTTWTGATNGSGSALLTDADSSITGLEVLHNVVVIPRATGFHLAYPTGTAFPLAFRLETWNKHRIGAPWASTIATANNVMYFVGEDDVYTFDLNTFTSIGKQIRNILIPTLQTLNNTSNFYKGFITYTNEGFESFVPPISRAYQQPGMRYHLIQIGANPTTHYSYNIAEGTWSVHQYGFQVDAASDGAESLAGAPTVLTGPTIYDNSSPSNRFPWILGQPCEQEAHIIGPVHQIGQREIDVTLERILISARDYGPTQVTVSFTNRLGTQIGSGSVTKTFGANTDFYLIRSWFDQFTIGANPTGNSFQITISVPPNVHTFSTHYYNLRCIYAGDFRG